MANSSINYKHDSFRGAAAVTPSDSVTQHYSGFYVGGLGNVAVEDSTGNTVTLTAVPVGTVIELAVCKVLATGTTATNIVGLS